MQTAGMIAEGRPASKKQLTACEWAMSGGVDYISQGGARKLLDWFKTSILDRLTDADVRRMAGNISACQTDAELESLSTIDNNFRGWRKDTAFAALAVHDAPIGLVRELIAKQPGQALALAGEWPKLVKAGLAWGVIGRRQVTAPRNLGKRKS